MSAKITPITTAPAAFSGIVAKLNEVIAANPPLQAGKGISITPAKENTIISIKLTADDINQVLLISRTFFVSGGTSANVAVTAGAINSVVYAGGTIIAPSNGHKIYIDATISGTTATAVTVASAASVPADTSTHVYTLLATVAVASSIATPTPVAWNYSQLQICAGQGLWGGFGA
jgi:hypothetical protein